MGWLYGYDWRTAKDVRDHLRDQFKQAGLEVKAEALVAYGHRYWAALKSQKSGKTVVFLALLNGGKLHGDISWGYKDMDEGSAPYDVDCPLSVLDAADPEPPNEWAREWRLRVRAHWARKAASRQLAKSVKPGDLVAVEHAAHSPYTIVEVRQNGRRRVVIGEGTNGGHYRLPASRLTLVAERLGLVQGYAPVAV